MPQLGIVMALSFRDRYPLFYIHEADEIVSGGEEQAYKEPRE